MKLGNILKMRGGTPQTGRPVRFQLRQKQKDGSFHRIWAEAQLLPVSVSEVADVHAEVADYLAEHPAANKKDETNIRFMAKALHDAEKNSLKFVDSDQIEEFSKSLVMQQVAWLIVQYNLMIRGEYAECWSSVEEREGAEQQAENFTDEDPELLSES